MYIISFQSYIFVFKVNKALYFLFLTFLSKIKKCKYTIYFLSTTNIFANNFRHNTNKFEYQIYITIQKTFHIFIKSPI